MKFYLKVIFITFNIYVCCFFAFIYAHSLLYNNGVFTIDCNSIGEGWSEVILFIIMAIIGVVVLASDVLSDS